MSPAIKCGEKMTAPRSREKRQGSLDDSRDTEISDVHKNILVQFKDRDAGDRSEWGAFPHRCKKKPRRTYKYRMRGINQPRPLLLTPEHAPSVPRLIISGGPGMLLIQQSHLRASRRTLGQPAHILSRAGRDLPSALLCQRCIELNPVRADMVSDPEENSCPAIAPTLWGKRMLSSRLTPLPRPLL
jgi:hypothetical protein